MIQLWSQIGRPVPRECDTRMRDPKCGRGCKQSSAVVFHGPYRSSELNKSIIISIIDRNVCHDLWKNVSSVNMIKKGDRFDR